MQINKKRPKEHGNNGKIQGAPKSEGIQKPLRILIVEDDDNCRRSLARTLGKDNFEVESARNGQEGLERYKKGGIDIVITDIRMPVMDGFTLLMELLDFDPKTRVIVVSSLITNDNHSMLMGAGAKRVMAKPYDLEEIHIAINEVSRN
ncbi:response regulator [Candidatus Micrarchaeota archaeon]|nr:response regulator [Candidatus Micrarchaeota archaeon]